MRYPILGKLVVDDDAKLRSIVFPYKIESHEVRADNEQTWITDGFPFLFKWGFAHGYHLIKMELNTKYFSLEDNV